MKNLFKLLLIICLIASTFTVIASAEVIDGKCGENANWSLDTDTGLLTINGSGEMYDVASEESPWYLHRKNIKSVIIEKGILCIGKYAFADCESLTSATIPNSISSIGAWSFSGCSALTSITIPDGITGIGEYAFAGCYSLASVSISIGLINICEGAFLSCASLTSITIPEGVTWIGNYAFSFCESLEKVVIYSEDLTIDEFSFDPVGFALHGYVGSTAETYAKNNNIPFVALTNNDVTIDNQSTEKCIIMTIDSSDALVFGKPAKTDVPPIIENNRTMLPARFIAEALGATVSWDAPTRTATIEGNGVTIKITVDSNIAYINGKEVTLDSPAFIRDNRTYTPVRFIAEALGATVKWNAETRQAIFTK